MICCVFSAVLAAGRDTDSGVVASTSEDSVANSGQSGDDVTTGGQSGDGGGPGGQLCEVTATGSADTSGILVFGSDLDMPGRGFAIKSFFLLLLYLS